MVFTEPPPAHGLHVRCSSECDSPRTCLPQVHFPPPVGLHRQARQARERGVKSAEGPKRSVCVFPFSFKPPVALIFDSFLNCFASSDPHISTVCIHAMVRNMLPWSGVL